MIAIDDCLNEDEMTTLLNKYINNRNHVHEEKVEKISMELFEIVTESHLLTATDKQLLKAGAILHDIGYFINKRDHQKHSRYLILNDHLLDRLPVLTRIELALICENHRKNEPLNLQGLAFNREPDIIKLIAILRLADVLSSKHIHKIYFKNFNQNLVLNLEVDDIYNARFLKKLDLKSSLSKQLFHLQTNICNINP